MIAAEKKWSVQWEDRSMGNDVTGSIKSSSSESPAVLHKTAEINFSSFALAAEIWETR